jgi:hypothetical protein
LRLTMFAAATTMAQVLVHRQKVVAGVTLAGVRQAS